MAHPTLSRSARLSVIIGISFSFFVIEIGVGFYTRSLALVADAFHYLNDLIGFIVALVALKVSEKPDSTPSTLTFGWQRSQLLGAFFNGVFLLALGVSILLQSIERFVSLERVENPKLVLIVGCVGFTLNIISAFFLHEHGHDHHGHHHGHGNSDTEHDEMPTEFDNLATAHENHRHTNNSNPVKKSYDLGVMGVLLHVVGDAINNIGVIIAALVIWLANYEGRFYADPGVSVGIALLILASAIPLVKNSGSILLESVPLGVNLDDVQHDLETIPGILSIHELHAWRLNQNKAIASAHVVTSDSSLANFMARAQRIGECLHAYGIHSVTLQPELASATSASASASSGVSVSVVENPEEDVGSGNGNGEARGAVAGLRLRREEGRDAMYLKTIILHARFKIAQSIFGSLGSTVVKVSRKYVIKGPCKLPELEALLYISEHTTIPVPRVRYTYNGPGGIYIMMDYIQGTDLETLWMRDLKPKEKEIIINDITAILTQLRTLRPFKEGVVASANGGAVLDYRIGSQLVGPFQSHSTFHSFLRGGVPLETTTKVFGEEITSCHSKNYRTFFSHSDLAPRNIIIRNGRIVGVVDWALAGWYPEYWDLTKAYYTSFKVPDWPESIKLKFPSYADELVAERLLWRLYDEPGNVSGN
ncbi:hypothetical protein FQN51_004185 [Onygenales sp. PD_10]|nr:hypothetical protein FQN51_004185 [Onygenales sp. PD_10]